VAGEESVSFLILTSNLHFSVILLHLHFYSRVGERTGMAGSDLMDL
jgi:hypothetical protein